ncbi:MAG: YihY/virulence factor BrkB family protein [Planctomycetaceae bacterium]|nr:YihY/virulence factor BrkB family protein [Planctomycetaceae bacterium]
MMKIFKALRQAGKDFAEDECMASGAALAYYTIFSLPPMLVIVFAVAGWFGVQESKIDSMVKSQLGMPISTLPEEAEDVPEEEQGARQERRGAIANIAGLGWLSNLFGIGLLVFSATGLFTQFQKSLNRAWEVRRATRKKKMWGFVLKRALSLGMVAIIAFVLLISLVLTMLVDETLDLITGEKVDSAVMGLGLLVDNLVTLVIGTLLFTVMFKILPDAKTSWRDMLAGSFFTALMFVVGKTVIGWYLRNADIGSHWGSAASSLVAVLVWVYYSSIIVLFGAEFTQVWAQLYGRGIQPARGAVRASRRKHQIDFEPNPQTGG